MHELRVWEISLLLLRMIPVPLGADRISDGPIPLSFFFKKIFLGGRFKREGTYVYLMRFMLLCGKTHHSIIK